MNYVSSEITIPDVAGRIAAVLGGDGFSPCFALMTDSPDRLCVSRSPIAYIEQGEEVTG